MEQLNSELSKEATPAKRESDRNRTPVCINLRTAFTLSRELCELRTSKNNTELASFPGQTGPLVITLSTPHLVTEAVVHLVRQYTKLYSRTLKQRVEYIHYRNL